MLYPCGVLGTQRVVVAMSGGVDSSAAAALLCAQGYDVVGVTLKLYDASGTSASIGGRCCSPRDIDDARAVAAHLDFPHYVLDEVSPFRAAVIDDFVAEYRMGRTPNPCVRCNERIKFGPLLSFADAIGAGALATGHYARLQPGDAGAPPRLLRAVDGDKDQSYFLFGVRPDLLRRVLFPVGDLDKQQVRDLARKAGLPTCDKPDSNQICFIPDGDHMAFVEKQGGAGPTGRIVDETGRTLGAHEGTHRFTIGQRRGLPGVDGKRRFVLRIDPGNGTVHTGPREGLVRDRLTARTVLWLQSAPTTSVPCRIQIRHRGKLLPGRITPDVDCTDVKIEFDTPVEGGAPGQAAVFYDHDDAVIGGGWIAGEDAPAAHATARVG